MYIPEFVVGFIVGMGVELIVLISLSLWIDRKKK